MIVNSFFEKLARPGFEAGSSTKSTFLPYWSTVRKALGLRLTTKEFDECAFDGAELDSIDKQVD